MRQNSENILWKSSHRLSFAHDNLNPGELFEDIAASYSAAQEEVPDDDPVVPIWPAQALAAIQTLRYWEEQQNDST